MSISRGLQALVLYLVQGRAHGAIKTLEDFRNLFRLLQPAPESRSGLNDELFARLRLAGPNPLTIRSVETGLSDRLAKEINDPTIFKLLSERLEQASLTNFGSGLDQLSAQGRLFEANYRALHGIPGGHFPRPKVLYGPLAWFACDAKGKRLRPLGISLFPGHLSLPGEGDWAAARLAVQSADVHVHQAIHHLAHTHLLLGVVALATHRELSARHPVHRLLAPHLQGNLFINWLAQRSLLAAGGSVAALLAPELRGVVGLAVKSLQGIDVRTLELPANLAARGLLSPETLEDYPYRDCGLPIWEAISRMVVEFCLVVYPDDAWIGEDAELQGWVRCLEDPAQGGLLGFSEADGKLRSRAGLVRTLTHLIYRASAGHAALNFPQRGLMGNPEIFPLALYGEVREGQQIEDLVPDLNQAHAQVNLGEILGGICHTRLGAYPKGHFQSAALRATVRQFQERLRQLEHEQATNNPDYAYLRPSRIPQSTNI